MNRKEYDVIVVGSGAGGSTVAREMALKGKKVLLLEKGGRTNMMGNTLTMALILQN
jgi:choline dehydrogenase-like flavoprotein